MRYISIPLKDNKNSEVFEKIKENEAWINKPIGKYLTGTLKKIEKSEKEFNGKITPKIRYIFDTDGGECQLDLPVKSSESVLNALASCVNFSNISFNHYLDKNGYDRIGVSQNRKKLNWKYSPEQIPKVEKVIVGSKEFPNDEKRVAFFSGVLEEVQKKLGQSKVDEDGLPTEVDLDDIVV